MYIKHVNFPFQIRRLFRPAVFFLSVDFQKTAAALTLWVSPRSSLAAEWYELIKARTGGGVFFDWGNHRYKAFQRGHLC